MDNQEKYNDLENLYYNLKVLIDETSLEDYKNELQEILSEVKNEMEDLEEVLSNEYKEEMQEREYEYRKIQGF